MTDIENHHLAPPGWRAVWDRYAPLSVTFLFSTILCIFVHQKYRPRTNYYCSRSKTVLKIKVRSWQLRETIACKAHWEWSKPEVSSLVSALDAVDSCYSRAVRILVRFFHYHFPLKNLLKCWVAHLHFDLCHYYRYLEVMEKNNGHGGNIADHYQGDYWNYFLYTQIFSLFYMFHVV